MEGQEGRGERGKDKLERLEALHKELLIKDDLIYTYHQRSTMSTDA